MYLQTTYKRPCIRIRLCFSNRVMYRVWFCTAVPISNTVIPGKSVNVHVLTCSL